MTISVVYAVYNEEQMLARSLASVQEWADEIIVVDGESTDKTVEIAKSFNAQVIETTNKANFHINKQMAIDAATGELILQLDADEVVDGLLREFIEKVAAERDPQYVAWQIKRKNLFFGRWLTKGGQYPDMVIRLFYKGSAYLPAKDVHEQMVVKGKVGVASGHLQHFANPDLETYWRKFNTYTSFKASQLAAEKVPITRGNYMKYWFAKPLTTFFSLYVRHRGYVDGAAGFLFALFSSWHHVVSWAKYVQSQQGVPDGRLSVFFPGNETEKKQNRGVGRFMRWLVQAVEQVPTVKVVAREAKAQIVHYLFFEPFRVSLQFVNRDQKLVVTVHDLIPLLFPKNYPVGIKGKINFWRQKRRLRRADMVVVDSKATKKDVIEKIKLPPEKVKVVYLAANPNLRPAGEREISQVKKGYALARPYILYVGDINFNKNLPQLIKAMKFVDAGIDLVMVGKNFVPQEIPEWQAISEQLDLSEVKSRVKFLTNVTMDSELSALYTGAACCVQPSLYEGFGLPVLEAMRCRTPVVCARNSSLVEVGGQVAFYAASTRAEDLAAAIGEVLALDSSTRIARLDAAESWQATFSWEKAAAQMTRIYEQVAS